MSTVIPGAAQVPASDPALSVGSIQPDDLIVLMRPGSDGSFATFNLTGAALMAALFANIPTSDPGVAGQKWLNGGVVMVSERTPS